MTTASVMAVVMDIFTVPRRTPKYAVASRTSEIRIHTRLEKSSKTIFYAIKQQYSQTKRSVASLHGLFVPHPCGGGMRLMGDLEELVYESDLIRTCGFHARYCPGQIMRMTSNPLCWLSESTLKQVRMPCDGRYPPAPILASPELPHCDLWHDRPVFHFLVEPDDQFRRLSSDK
jgi:hypothetical protein